MFNFPNAPTEGATFTPGPDLPSYAFKDGVWRATGDSNAYAVELVFGSSYTPILIDANTKLKQLSHSTGVTLTIPPNSSVAYKIGDTLTFEQEGAGVVTVVPGPGVTVTPSYGLSRRSAGIGSVFWLIKEGVNNWALRGALVSPRLNTLVQLSVIDRDLTAPPTVAINGDCYIPKAPATGAWVGRENNIVSYSDGAWEFYVPEKGWLAGVDDEDATLRYDGIYWVPVQDLTVHSTVGAWTPTLVGLTSGAAVLSTADAQYCKTGEMVQFSGHIVTSNTAGITGQLAIGIDALPYVPAFGPGAAGRVGVMIPFWAGLSLPDGSLQLSGFLQDADRIRLYRSILTAGNQAVLESHISGSVTLYFSGSFRSAL